MVLHRGKILYEKYFDVNTPSTQRLSQSVIKSSFDTLGAMLVNEGTLDPQANVNRYIPELKDSAFGDATVRHVLDMTTDLKYSDAYAELVGWLIRRATGQTVGQVLSECIWSKLGAERDSYLMVDRGGNEFGGGGFNLTSRDMARFGEMMRLDGRFKGQQIVLKAVVDDIRGAARPSLRRRATPRCSVGATATCGGRSTTSTALMRPAVSTDRRSTSTRRAKW